MNYKGNSDTHYTLYKDRVTFMKCTTIFGKQYTYISQQARTMGRHMFSEGNIDEHQTLSVDRA